MYSATCNLNCICVNSDCKFNHFISYKERKIVKKQFMTLTNISKEEPSAETRKKNCNFGQLCINKDCGFRHRLCFENREKLSVLYKYNKICPDKIDSKINKSLKSSVVSNEIEKKNYFLTLEDVPDVEVIDDIQVKSKEVIDVKPFIPPVYNGKSWATVVKDVPKPKMVNLNVETSNWEDLADDDFYMKF